MFAKLNREMREIDVATVRTYGHDAFCYDCQAIGEKIGHASIGDTLHCTKCHAEWCAVSLLRED